MLLFIHYIRLRRLTKWSKSKTVTVVIYHELVEIVGGSEAPYAPFMPPLVSVLENAQNIKREC